MRLSLITLALLLLSSATAMASDLRTSTYMECNGDIGCSKYAAGSSELQLTFTGAAGESNALVIEPTGDGRLRVKDGRKVEFSAQSCPACERVSDQEVLAPLPRLTIVDLGDGPDTATIRAGAKTVVNGGEGDDVLTGSPGSEQFDGGAGRDRVQAGDGDDTLIGTPAGDAGDVLDGGGGADFVSYSARRTPLILDLGRPEASTLDTVTNVESVLGGSGDDVLTGSGAANSLQGGGGDDQLAGGEGDDRLLGGSGADRLDGGGGADTLAVYDETAETVTCGPGADVVAGVIDVGDIYREGAWRGADPFDVLASDCESMALSGSASEHDPLLVDPRAAVTGRRVLLRNPCATLAARPCSGTVRVGRAARRFRAGPRWVVLRLRRARRRVPLTLRVRTGADEYRAAWTVGPRAPVG